MKNEQRTDLSISEVGYEITAEPLGDPERRPTMTDLNQYLRRAEVEALIEGEIANQERAAQRQWNATTSAERWKMLHDISAARAKQDALRALKRQLATCLEITLQTPPGLKGATDKI